MSEQPKLLLAIDRSAAMGSIALFRDGELSADCSWREPQRGSLLLAHLKGLIEAESVNWDDVDCFAAGRGPGNYSGLRNTITVIRSLALPGKNRVYGLSSGEALAWRLSACRSQQHVAVIGDARRDRLWYGLFERSETGVTAVGDWELCATAELDEKLPSDALRVSPDWDRLSAVLAPAGLDLSQWLQMCCLPQARDLGARVLERINLGIPSEELKPIYMHPPVFVEPRFPA